MRRHHSGALAARLLVLLLASIAAGCGDTGKAGEGGAAAPGEMAPPSGYPITVVDDAGVTHRFDAAPERIVSIVPSATEFLLALGVGGRIVGRTEYDLDERIAHVPSVGGGLEPSIERIVALRPDLVIRFLAESDLETPRTLDNVGIRHLAIRPDDMQDIRRIVTLLGRVMNRDAEATTLIAGIDAELNSLAALLAGAPRRRVAFLLGGDPPLVAGEGTYLHELIEAGGGENVFADTGALYAPVSLEAFVRRRVEVILVLGEAGVPPFLSSIPSYTVPAQLPGLNVAAAAREIARILHPELVR